MQQDNHKDLEVWRFLTRVSYQKWLSGNFKRQDSMWLQFAKKASDENTLSYSEAREVAIMHGWIDGLINKFDTDFYLIKFSPRRPKSLWSKINRSIAEQLIKRGEMLPSGLEQVELARADGRWGAAYDSASTITESKDFLKALKKDSAARALLDACTI